MTKKSVETPEIETLGEAAMSKTELFFENNGKKVALAIFALLVVASAVFGYKELVVNPNEARASEALYSAQVAIELDDPDYQIALNGVGNSDGFLDVIENYGSTKAANLANHYAGVCYLKMGNYASAKRYLSAYKAQKGVPAQIINSQNIALQGDVAVEEGNFAAAVPMFVKASEIADNLLTSPLYLRKAAQAAIAAKDMAKAEQLLKQVIAKYPASSEARTAEKYLGSIQ